jgi:hypothetical protein
MPQPTHTHHAGQSLVATHPAAHHAALQKPLWIVVRQELDNRYTPGTDPVEEWVVYYVTRSGVESSIRIPRDLYSPEVAAAMIQPEAEMLEHVAHLQAEAKH